MMGVLDVQFSFVWFSGAGQITRALASVHILHGEPEQPSTVIKTPSSGSLR